MFQVCRESSVTALVATYRNTPVFAVRCQDMIVFGDKTQTITGVNQRLERDREDETHVFQLSAHVESHTDTQQKTAKLLSSP